MDNDNKVDDSVSFVVEEFLKEEIEKIPGASGGKKYDIVTSYESTAKNWWLNLKPVALKMLLCFTVVFMITAAIMYTAANHYNKIKVEVKEFENLNLNNLLNIVSQLKQSIKEEDSLLKSYIQERNRINTEARRDFESSLKTLNSLNLKNSYQYRLRRSEIQRTYEEKMEKVAFLDAQISDSQNRINGYKEDLAKYDSAKVRNAGNSDSGSLLHELETQKIYSSFEDQIEKLRENMDKEKAEQLLDQKQLVGYILNEYDPSFSSDKEIQELIKKVKSQYESSYIGSSFPVSQKASSEFKEALEKQNMYESELSLIAEKFKYLPQRKAIQSFASCMDTIAATSANEIASASVKEINSLIEKNDQLAFSNSNYHYLLDSLCGMNTEDTDDDIDGFVIRQKDDFYQLYISTFCRQKLVLYAPEDYTFPAEVFSKATDEIIADGFLTYNEQDGMYYFVPEDIYNQALITGGDSFILMEPQPIEKEILTNPEQ